MSALPVTASGVWYLSDTAPQATHATNGLFYLTLNVLDHQGPHMVQACFVHWFGNDAFDFHSLQAHLLQPGVPLALELVQLRCLMVRSKRIRAELHAMVASLLVLPFANQRLRDLQDKLSSSPCMTGASSY